MLHELPAEVVSETLIVQHDFFWSHKGFLADNTRNVTDLSESLYFVDNIEKFMAAGKLLSHSLAIFILPSDQTKPNQGIHVSEFSVVAMIPAVHNSCSRCRFRPTTLAARRNTAPVITSATKEIQTSARDQPNLMSISTRTSLLLRRQTASSKAAAEYAM